RRPNQGAPEDGGWHMFFTNWMVPEISDPLINVMVSGRGDDAWFGWPTDPEIEDLRADFIAAEDDASRKEVAVKIQEHVMDNVNYIMLGEYLTPQARRTTIDNIVPSPVPVFWNMTKSED